MAFVLYLLATHPEEQKKLRVAVNELLGMSSEVTKKNIQDAKFPYHVIKETLRLVEYGSLIVKLTTII